jgi:hypothetical protein
VSIDWRPSDMRNRHRYLDCEIDARRDRPDGLRESDEGWSDLAEGAVAEVLFSDFNDVITRNLFMSTAAD